MNEPDVLLIIRGMIATIFSLWIIIYYLLLLNGRRILSSKSFYVLIITVGLSVLIQTLSYLLIINEYFSIIFICGGGFISVAAFLIVFLSTPKISRNQQLVNKFSKIVAIALLFNLIIPLYLSNWIMEECDSRHREMAMPIINAIIEYKADNDFYPAELRLLVPKYTSDIPVPFCFQVYHPFIPKLTQPDFLRSVDYDVMMKLIRLQKMNYYIVNSNWEEEGVHYEEHYLYVSNFNLNEFQRYNLLTQTWENNQYDY